MKNKIVINREKMLQKKQTKNSIVSQKLNIG